MSPIKFISTDIQLETTLKRQGGNGCVILFFYLPWCGFCASMHRSVERMADKHPSIVVLKTDAQKCVQSSARHGVKRVPLFVLFKNGDKVDRVEGASAVELERKIDRIQSELMAHQRFRSKPSSKSRSRKSLNKNSRSKESKSKESTKQSKSKSKSKSKARSDSTSASTSAASKSGSARTQPQSEPEPSKKMVAMTDLSPYIDKNKCGVLNDLIPSTTFQGFMEGERLVLGAGMGRVLLIYGFKEPMMIKSFKIKAPLDKGPHVLRFFTNCDSVGINQLLETQPTQEVVLSAQDLGGKDPIDLKEGNFNEITQLEILIIENMTGSKLVEITSLTLTGATVSSLTL